MKKGRKKDKARAGEDGREEIFLVYGYHPQITALCLAFVTLLTSLALIWYDKQKEQRD